MTTAAYTALAARYPESEPVVRHGRTYPVALLPRGTVDATSVLRVQEKLVGDSGQLRTAGHAHLADLRHQYPALHDGPILALNDIAADGGLSVGPAGYFAMIATCDSLRDEWESGRRGAAAVLRSIADAAAGEHGPLVSGAGRVAAIGVSVVTTLPGRPVRSLLTGRRRPSLGTDSGSWHVAPSGMLEPRPEAPLIGTIRAELREELGLELAPSILAERIRLLGVVVDLLRLRPEICVRLDLTVKEEAALAPPLSSNEFDDWERVPLDRNRLATWWKAHSPGEVAPAGAGAIGLLEADLALD